MIGFVVETRVGHARPDDARGGLGAGFTTAVAWFTRIPVGSRAERGAFAAALGWLPLIGVVVGGVGAGVRVLAGPWVGALPAAVLAVVAMVLVTGAYHEDGLADTADGLWGGATVERRLEIMRDSRLGTYGAAALCLDLLLKTSLVVGLSGWNAVRALVVAHVLGRASVLPLRAWLPDARGDGAGVALPRPDARAWLLASLITVVVLGAAFATLPQGVVAAAVAVAAATLGAGAIGLLARRRLGGITGDVFGAANEVAQLAVLLGLVVWWS